jgi:hypothetical protein
MATLHIEHAITDFAVWRTAFDRFADARDRAGSSGPRSGDRWTTRITS